MIRNVVLCFLCLGSLMGSIGFFKDFVEMTDYSGRFVFLFTGIFFAFLTIYILIYIIFTLTSKSTKKLTKIFNIIFSINMMVFMIYNLIMFFANGTGDFFTILFQLIAAIFFLNKGLSISIEDDKLDIYSCPDCHSDIQYSNKKCENCGCNLDWSDVKETKK